MVHCVSSLVILMLLWNPTDKAALIGDNFAFDDLERKGHPVGVVKKYSRGNFYYTAAASS